MRPNTTLMEDGNPDAETIRRAASDLARVVLSPAEVDAVLTVLKGLLPEIDKITLLDRTDSEPESRFAVEVWVK
jgi:hypothetical protein